MYYRGNKGGHDMTQINVRVDDEVKKAAEEVCDNLGLSLSSAINIFLKKVARERRIPFEVSLDPFYDKANMERLRKRIEDLESGKSVLVEHDLIEE